mmetsp:Transcript_76505/g.211777  ORF Transcript_76505/g.211777 Transcript_76505/m.211777 type:complete len:95 (-) Transcript_76505:199-483(-)
MRPEPPSAASSPASRSSGARAQVVFYTRSTVAFIRRILPQGLLDEHNQQFPELAVRPGDFLVAVNGQRGTSRELVELLTASEEPELTISRPEGA